MEFGGKSRRIRERLELSMPVRVRGREAGGKDWMELTRLIDVTPFGARMQLGRPSEPGRLLQLTMPMPRQLRSFDHAEDQYRVWSLVRNVKTVAIAEDQPPRYEVGVAFVGKYAPASYERDPTTRYSITPQSSGGMWDLMEDARPSETGPDAQIDKRRDTRHLMPVDVIVEVLDDKGEPQAQEMTVTENISRRGAAVFTTLNVERGRFVRLKSAQFGLSVLGVVRARRLGAGNIPRLHLEFVDKQWPLD